jgi:glucose-1-phosphate adenylyltransferase
VHDDPDRTGRAIESLVSPGVIVSGSSVRRSVLSPGVYVHSRADIDNSIVLNNVDVGRGSTVHRAILDKGVVVRPGATVGVDHDADRERGFVVSPGGVTVVGKGGVVA